MENDEQSVDLFNFVAWLHVHKKRIISISAAVIVLVGIVGLYVWHKNYVETQAATALSNIQTQPRTTTAVPAAEPFVKVAEDYPKTQAGARSLLIAGGYLFESGKYDQAGKTFGRFLSDYPENPMANQALLGLAASSEASGDITNAVTRYEDLIKRHQADSTTPQAKSALARLYLAEKKPERARDLYEELARSGNNDTWSAEAGIQLQELLNQYPNLRKTNAPPLAAKPGATVTIPAR